MGKKGKKAQAGRSKKLTPKEIGKRLDALVVKLEKELEGADLFAPLPPTEDCPICLVPLSRISTQVDYKACCGKAIREGCMGESQKFVDKQTEQVCPFCREVEPQSCEECVRQLETRAKKDDPLAWCLLGMYFESGETPSNPVSGIKHKVVKRDILRGVDCWIRAAELGNARACGFLSVSYKRGDGVSVDKERTLLLYRVGTLRGDIISRHYLGSSEYGKGNHEVAIHHWKIAAEAGNQLSLDKLTYIFNAESKIPGEEFISKEYLNKAYRLCHEAQKKVKSEEREKHTQAQDLVIEMKC